MTNIAGVQNESPQNVPPWHADYFQLKTLKAHQTQSPSLSVLLLLPPSLFPSHYLPKGIQIENPTLRRET